MAKTNEEKKINKEKLKQKRLELEKELMDKIEKGMNENKTIDENELEDIFLLLDEINKTKNSKLNRFITTIKRLILCYCVHLLSNVLLMALFSFDLILENKITLIPIILSLSALFTIADNAWNIFRIRTMKRKSILYGLFILNMMLILFVLNNYYPVFRFSSIWIIYIISEALVVFFSLSAIEKGLLMFSRG